MSHDIIITYDIHLSEWQCMSHRNKKLECRFYSQFCKQSSILKMSADGGSMIDTSILSNIRIIAVRSFFETRTCIACGDAVSSKIDRKLKRCNGCACLQLTEECPHSYAVHIIVSMVLDRQISLWVYDKDVLEIANCSETEITETKLLQTGFFSVVVCQNQIIEVTNVCQWFSLLHWCYVIIIPRH